MLPKNFTWAYGSWDIKQDIPNGYPEEYKAFIGNDYVQLMPASTVEDCICPYIEAMPQKDYRVSVGEPVDYSNTHEDMVPPPLFVESYDSSTPVKADEICLYFKPAGESPEVLLYLNRKNKTISTYSTAEIKEKGITITSVRNKENPSDAVLAEYEAFLSSSPLIGEWQDVSNRWNKIEISPERLKSGFIPSAGGIWLDYANDVFYQYDEDRDRLINEHIAYGDVEYRRYNAEQERLDEIKRILTSKTFSCMQNDVYSNSTYLHAYTFKSNGTGTKAFYEVQPFGKRLIDSESFEWEIDGESVKVYDKSAAAGSYDRFTIKRGLFGDSFINGVNTYD